MPVDHYVFEAAFHFKVLPERIRQTPPAVLTLCRHMNATMIAPTIEEIEAMDERDQRWMIVYLEQLPSALQKRAEREIERRVR